MPHYRQLIVWRKSMDLAKEVYRLSNRLPREETWGIRAQITRAAVSVPANVAEGWTRESPRDRANFLSIAHGSLAGVETLLTLGEEMNWLETPDCRPARALIDEVGKILGTMCTRLRPPPRS